MTRVLALTLGEPAGIGPDITFAAWRRRQELDLPPFYLLADPEFLRRRAAKMAIDVPIAVVEPADAEAAFPTIFRWSISTVRVGCEPGRPDDTSAPAALAAIRRAVADVCAGTAVAVVTNPVAKNILYRSGFTDPGHTEYLAKLAEEATGVGAHPVMLLWSPELAVVPVTIHLPLKDVVTTLTTELIVQTGRNRSTRPPRPFRYYTSPLRLPDSIRMRGKRERSGPKMRPSCDRRSSAWSPRASMHAARCLQTACSTRRRAQPTMSRWRCTMTRL